MTNQAYLRALKKLGLAPHSKATAAALGVTLRTVQRYALDEQAVPRTVELLLQQYLAHGLPQL